MDTQRAEAVGNLMSTFRMVVVQEPRGGCQTEEETEDANVRSGACMPIKA